ncbi:unnamed protein product [Ectocarpus sp. 4 AP-2014]
MSVLYDLRVILFRLSLLTRATLCRHGPSAGQRWRLDGLGGAVGLWYVASLRDFLRAAANFSSVVHCHPQCCGTFKKETVVKFSRVRSPPKLERLRGVLTHPRRACWLLVIFL